MKTRRRFAKKNGFTVIEMLLVVGLIVIMAGVAGGFYAGTYKKASVRKSVREFLLAARYARVLAIERQSKCQLKLDAANNGFMLVIDQLDTEAGTDGQLVKDLYFKPVKFAEDVKFENIKIEPADLQESLEIDQENIITFFHDGTAQTAVVQIGDGRDHYTISISAANGKVRISERTAEKLKSDTIDLDEQ